MKLEIPDFRKLLKIKPKSHLGIDIGTSAIKIVQLGVSRDTFKLENYGEVKFFSEEAPMEVFEQSSLKIPDEQVAELLKKIMKDSGATARQVAFSLPTFSSFSTIIEMPPLGPEEMKKAIQFEARQYIPIPIDEVSIDSVILGEERKKTREMRTTAKSGAENTPQARKRVEVMLMAVPNEIKKKYTHIAQLVGLELVSLEMETFPLARALLKGDPQITAVVDLGARSTDVCIVDEGVVRISHNLELSGVDLTEAYGEFAHANFMEAEKKKKMTGLDLTPGQLVEAKGVLTVIDNIISETDRIIHSYFNKTERSVVQIVLAGGGASMPGLLERFQAHFSYFAKDAIHIGNPFKYLVYPKELEKTLEGIGPSYAVAVGLAMRK